MMKVVFSMSSLTILIWLFPVYPSINEKRAYPVMLSTRTSICDKGKSSFGLALLKSQKSMHILTLSCFLGVGAMLATHWGYYTTLMKPASNYFRTSCLSLEPTLASFCRVSPLLVWHLDKEESYDQQYLNLCPTCVCKTKQKHLWIASRVK